MKTIGERIRELRSALGVSQADLADKVGMTQTGIASIESGTVSRPRRIVEIARALGVSPEDLLDDDAAHQIKQARNAMLEASHFLTRDGEAIRDVTGRLVDTAHIKVIGEIAAGVWRDPKQADEVEYRHLPVLVDPLIPIGSQFAFVVRGESANRIAGDGDIAVCLDLGLPRSRLDDFDLVVFERQISEDGPIERTLRRFVQMGPNEAELRFDSDDPRYGQVISLAWPKAESGPQGGQIVANVEWIFRWPTKKVTINR
ncbi:putative HTH cro/C1-type domain-containing protein [Hyphomicrobiales bacterium]|nr:putative HTH cro/C1-type domain-containing protein [Hyphomicrobiales bacterium]CAH1673301.1 Transcriptional regulator with XRE-family HTH domain [Hyphomicrobiales bacterium]